MRLLRLFGVLILVAGSVACKRQASDAPAPPPPPPPQPLFTLQFAGLDQLAADTNAVKLNAIAALPESATILSNLVQRLTAACARSIEPPANATHVDSSILRELVIEALRTESWLTSTAAAGRAPEWTLVLRLPDEVAHRWNAQLSQWLEGWTRTPTDSTTNTATASGWRAARNGSTAQWRLERSGGWLMIGHGPGPLSQFDETLARIRTAGRPGAEAPFDWLLLDAHTATIAPRLGWPTWLAGPPGRWPRLQLSVSGRNETVRTRAELSYDHNLELLLDPWRFPSNTIHAPVMSFGAARGLAGWLAALDAVHALGIDQLPNQLFAWAAEDLPVQSFVMLPAAEPARLLQQIASNLPAVIQKDFPGLASGELRWMTNRNGITWQVSPPIITPFLRIVEEPSNQFLLAGLFPLPPATNELPAALIEQFLPRPDLLYYHWEITQARINHWIPMAQLPTLISIDRARSLGQRPPMGALELPGREWLRAVAPMLGNTVTEVTRSSSNRLALVRNSHSGFTAFELLQLAGWLQPAATSNSPPTQSAPGPAPGLPALAVPAVPGASSAPNTSRSPAATQP
jgi:hypothetical protein